MTSLSYEIAGNGTAIVFLHGFCEAKEIWNSFTESLSKKYKTICIDLPGHGKSQPLETITLDALAQNVSDLLQHLKVDQFFLVGHSLGGYVSLAMAEKHPEYIKGLCLFHSSALEDSEEKKHSRDKSIEYVKNHGVDAFIKPFVPPLFFAGNRDRCQHAIDLIISIGLKMNAQSIIDTIKCMRDRPDRTQVLIDAKYPCLFIVGKNDTSVKLEDSMKQISLPSESYVQFLGDTAHQGLFERPQETLDMLTFFILNAKSI